MAARCRWFMLRTTSISLVLSSPISTARTRQLRQSRDHNYLCVSLGGLGASAVKLFCNRRDAKNAEGYAEDTNHDKTSPVSSQRVARRGICCIGKRTAAGRKSACSTHSDSDIHCSG